MKNTNPNSNISQHEFFSQKSDFKLADLEKLEIKDGEQKFLDKGREVIFTNTLIKSDDVSDLPNRGNFSTQRTIFLKEAYTHLLEDLSNLGKVYNFDSNKVVSITVGSTDGDLHAKSKNPLIISLGTSDKKEVKIVYKPRSMHGDLLLNKNLETLNLPKRNIMDCQNHGYDQFLSEKTVHKDLGSNPMLLVNKRKEQIIKDLSLLQVMDYMGIEDTHLDNFMLDDKENLHFIDAECFDTKVDGALHAKGLMHVFFAKYLNIKGIEVSKEFAVAGSLDKAEKYDSDHYKQLCANLPIQNFLNLEKPLSKDNVTRLVIYPTQEYAKVYIGADLENCIKNQAKNLLNWTQKIPNIQLNDDFHDVLAQDNKKCFASGDIPAFFLKGNMITCATSGNTLTND